MRFARVHILALLLGTFVVSTARAQDATPGVASLDPIEASMSLSSDGGTYIYFNKWAGDGVGIQDSYQQFGFRANWFDLDAYGSHLFSETHLYISDHSRIGYNLGGGLRWEYDTGFFGINSFFDQTETAAGNTYRQVTVGAEYLHDGLDLLANGYFGLSDTTSNIVAVTDPTGPAFFRDNNIFTQGTGLLERAYDGFDFEGGIPFPGLEPVRMYAGTYFLTGDDDDVWGVRSRVQARVGQGTILNFIVSDDSTWGTNLNFQAEFMFWGEVPTRMPYDYSAFSRRFDPVRRNPVVHTSVVETTVDVPVINPRTNLPWTVYHIDNTGGAGVGTFEDRANMLPAMTPEDLVLVYAGVGDTLGNITLIDHQQLLGEGKAHFIDTVDQGVIQLPDTFADTGPFPTLRPTNAAANIVTLASNNRVVGFNMVGSTAAAIGGANIDNFWIECVFADSTNGVNIANASGLGVIRDSTFDANGAGTGVFVSSTGMGPLVLDIDDVDNTGGVRNFDIVAAGSDIDLTADNITGDGSTDLGFRIAADGSTLNAVVNNADMTNTGRGFVQDVSNGGTIDSEFNNILATGTGNLFEANVVAGTTLNTDVNGGTFSGSTTGSGIAFDLMGATGQANFLNITANGNAVDGFNAVADGASNYNISIIDSTLIMNVDDSLDITSIGTSLVNVFYDPSDSSLNGDNGFEFLVDGGSELNAEFIDVDLSDNGTSAVRGITMGGSTTTLDFLRVNMDDSDTGVGLFLFVTDDSTLTGTFADSSVRSTDMDDNIQVLVTDGSDVDLEFTDTPADASADNGLVFLVDDGANGGSTLDIAVTNGTFDDNPGTNIVGSILDGSDVTFDFNNVTADNMGAVGGGLNIVATNSSSFVSTWVGGSISNTLANGVQGIGLGAGAGTTIDMSFTDVTIDGNAANGIAYVMTGPDAIANLTLDNSPVTNNGLNGVSATLIDTTGTFSATDSPFTGNGTSGAGSGFRMFASTDSVMTANFDNSDANDNATHGYHFNMALNSTINSVFAGNTATATNNGENGLLFEVLSGSSYDLALTGGDFSNNGQAGNFSGVRGLVDGFVGVDFSEAEVSFDGTLSDNNTLHGFEFLVSNDAVFDGNLESSGAFRDLSASDNENSGVRFEATGVFTVARLSMSGDNQFNNNGLLTGADGIDADANTVLQFGVQVSGNVNNNGGDGVDVSMNQVQLGSFDATGNGTGTVNDNQGHGFNIDFVDSGLITTGTPFGTIQDFNISDFAGINDNLLDGVNVFSDNTDALSAEIDGLTLTGNDSGIVIDLTNGSDWNLDITDNTAGPNDVFGIHVAADSGTQTTTIDGNTTSSNGDTNILVEYSGTADAEMHVDNNIVDGGLGTTVNEGILVTVEDTAHLSPSSIDGNFVQDNGGDNISMIIDDNAEVDNITLDGNTSTGAGGDGIHFEAFPTVGSTGVLGGLSISNSPEIGNNGGDGIDVFLADFEGLMGGVPDITIDDNINVHDNGGRGIAVEIIDTIAGGATSSVGSFSISQNMVTDNLGGDGIEVTLDDQSGDNALTVDSFTVTGTTASSNAGGGLSLSATNSTVTTTLIDQSGFEDNLGGDGVLLFGSNSLFDTVTIDDNGMAGNAGNGINLDLTGTPINTLNVTNHQMGSSVNIGLDFLLDGPTFPGGMPMGTYTITNTSDPGFDITSFIFDIAGSGNIFDTTAGLGFPFTPFGGTELTTGVTTINGFAVPPFDTTVGDNTTLIDVVFADFNPGESFQWDIDTDPSPMMQVGLNGSDMVGSTITVNFTGGLFLQGALFPVGGNPDASQFVSTFTNNTPGGITENQGSGIRISAQAGSHIGAMDISNNFITDNGLHGIDLIVDASNLPGAAAPATISGNDISGHVAGNGFNMVSPDTVTNDIGIDFTDNDITGNVIGTNIELDDSEILTTVMTGNNVSNNTSFGSRFIGQDSSGYNATIGDSGGNVTTYDQNVDAGIAFELTDNTVSNIVLENTTISGTTDGGNVNFDGDGLAIHTAMNAIIDPLTIGNAVAADTFFLDNAGNGLDIVAIENSQIDNMVVQNVSSNMNDGHGYSLSRFDNAHLGDPLVAPVMFVDSSATGNTTGSGLDVFTTNATLQPVYIDITGGVFDENNVGMNFHAQGDSVLVVQARGFSASNNETDGVRVLTEQTSTFGDVLGSGGDPDPGAGAVSSMFLGATVSDNGDNGFEFTASNDSRQSIIIDDNGGTRTVVDGNTDDGIVYNGGGSTVSFLGIADTDVTNANGVTTDDGIVIGLEGGANLEVEIDDVTIGSQVPSNIFPGMGGDGVNVNAGGNSDLTLTMTNSRIFNNGGDGYRGIHTGTSDFLGVFDNVDSRFNNARGFDIFVTSTDPDQSYTIMNSMASDNGDQGIFFATRATTDGSAQFTAQSPIVVPANRHDTGSPDNVEAVLNVFNSTITNNGQNVTDQGDGLVLAIGTNTLAEVNISGNTFGGNLLDDVRILPILSVNPATGVDTPGVAVGDMDTYVFDPVAHLDLAFGIQDLVADAAPPTLDTVNINTGDQINVTTAGNATLWTFADGSTAAGQFTNVDPFKGGTRSVFGDFQYVRSTGVPVFHINDNVFTQFAIIQDLEAAFNGAGFTPRDSAGTLDFPDPFFP